MKCEICGEKIELGILEKIKGTYIKKKVVCSSCQSKFKDKLSDQLKK